MSAKIMGQVWDYVLTHNQQAILLALADHAEHDGTSIRPSVARIMWKTSLSESTIRRALRELRDSGVLVVTRKARDHYPTEYRMVLQSLVRKAPFISEYQTLNRGVTQTPRGVSVGPSGVSHRPSGVSELRHPNRPPSRPLKPGTTANAPGTGLRGGTRELGDWITSLKATGGSS